MGKIYGNHGISADAKDIPDYVKAYAPAKRRDEVERRIAPLIVDRNSMSPLFIRFAIEQALEGEIESTSTVDLVLKYVEALRVGKVDISAGDMLRSASIAAVEAIRDSLVPREISWDYLRGVLVSETDRFPFMDARSEEKIDPAAVIEMLVQSGLLNQNLTNQNLQFAYDPVAEILAANWITHSPNEDRVVQLKKRILSVPDSAIAATITERQAQLSATRVLDVAPPT